MPKLTRRWMEGRIAARMRTGGWSYKTYTKGRVIRVNDSFQRGYRYKLSVKCGTKINAPIGGDHSKMFSPHLSPRSMLELGVFEGKYLNDCINEFPLEWYTWKSGAELNLHFNLSPERPDTECNFFKIKSRMSLRDWEENGWIPVTYSNAARSVLRKHGVSPREVDDPDPRGWFQWYCRYYLGRRLEIIDEIQMKRWYAFRRHAMQLKRHCRRNDITCRPRQQQALLQWSYWDVWRNM